jgi:hypothetical protein
VSVITIRPDSRCRGQYQKITDFTVVSIYENANAVRQKYAEKFTKVNLRVMVMTILTGE